MKSMGAARDREVEQRRSGGLERVLRVAAIVIIVFGFLFLGYVALLW